MTAHPQLIPEPPPPSKTGYGDRGARQPRLRVSPVTIWMDAMRAYPGVWFRYPERVANSTANDINRGRWSAPGEFEAVSRNTDTAARTANIWARYVGTSTATGDPS